MILFEKWVFFVFFFNHGNDAQVYVQHSEGLSVLTVGRPRKKEA